MNTQSYGTNRAAGSAIGQNDHSILKIGGFSDAVFNVPSSLQKNEASRFVRKVESVELLRRISFLLVNFVRLEALAVAVNETSCDK